MESFSLDFLSSRTLWLAILPLAALLLVWWTYRRTYPPVGRSYHLILVLLRVAVVAVVGLLIFEPVLRVRRIRERPERVALLVDRSASMLLPSTGRGGAQAPSRLALAQRLISESAVSTGIKIFTFGGALTEVDSLLSESEPQVEDRTDLASALEALKQRGQPDWDRVYVLSDGRVNAGKDPLLVAEGLPQVEAIMAGGYPQRPDLALVSVEQIRPAFAGGEVELELSVAAGRPQESIDRGAQAPVCDFFLNDRKIAEKKIDLGNGGARFAAATVSLPAPEAASYWLRSVLRPIESEWTVINNERIMRLEVSKNKRNLLLVSNSPDWDFTFLQRALELNDDWQVESILLLQSRESGPLIRRRDSEGRFTPISLPDAGALEELELLLLHGRLDRYDTAFLRRIARRADSGGFALVFWPADDLKTANLPAALARYLPFKQAQVSLVQVKAPEVPSVIFTLDRYNILAGLGSGTAIDDLPPVQWVFRGVLFKSTVEVLGRAGRRFPAGEPAPALIVAQPEDGTRVATVLAQGLWRWHMLNQDTSESRDTRYYSLWEALSRWLTAGEKRAGLALEPVREVFHRGEPVALEGRLGSEREDTAKGDLRVEIFVWRENEEKGVDTVAAVTAETEGVDGSFTVQLGRLPPGFYNYEGILAGGRMQQKNAGVFAVESYSPEMAVIEPDSGVMARLAKETGGSFHDGLDGQISLLSGSTEESVAGSWRLSHNLWIYSLLIAFLSAEWILRRRKALP